jgi:hypothetical protein
MAAQVDLEVAREDRAALRLPAVRPLHQDKEMPVVMLMALNILAVVEAALARQVA